MKRIHLLILLLTASLLVPVHARHRSDLVDTAVSAGAFKTLVAAVQAAGLVATLKGPGPDTDFAPTYAAFSKLHRGTLRSLLES